MPRRPRPASRGPRKPTATFSRQISNQSSKRPSVQQSDSSDEESEDKSDAGSSEPSNSPETHVPLPEEDDNVDASRVAQWVDEDDLDEWSSSNEPSNEKNDGEALNDDEAPELTSLQHDLSTIPLGALRKAQRELSRVQAGDDSGNETDLASEPENIPNTNIKSAEKPEWSSRPRTDIPKRKDKNAPIEVTSKRPVTRRRQIIDVPKMEPRDPRFLPFTGQLKPEAFRKQYEFLSDMHVTEFDALKDHLKRAKKLLISSPRHLREEREQEVARLELAFKKAESSVNRNKRERIEQQALAKAKKEENDKRKSGKGEWHMKNADKKQLLVRARYEALAADGGKTAVKKAIEKKQKKVGQREKRRRPFPSSTGGPSRKRPYNSDQERGGDSRKRQKVA